MSGGANIAAVASVVTLVRAPGVTSPEAIGPQAKKPRTTPLSRKSYLSHTRKRLQSSCLALYYLILYVNKIALLSTIM